MTDNLKLQRKLNITDELRAISPNEQGLAMWWNFITSSPELMHNKNTKDEDNKQKPIRITSAGTAADSDKMPKLKTSSHHIAKPFVIGCFNRNHC